MKRPPLATVSYHLSCHFPSTRSPISISLLCCPESGGQERERFDLRTVESLLLQRRRVLVGAAPMALGRADRSEEHTTELQSLMRNSYAVFCLQKKIETRLIDI